MTALFPRHPAAATRSGPPCRSPSRSQNDAGWSFSFEAVRNKPQGATVFGHDALDLLGHTSRKLGFDLQRDAHLGALEAGEVSEHLLDDPAGVRTSPEGIQGNAPVKPATGRDGGTRASLCWRAHFRGRGAGYGPNPAVRPRRPDAAGFTCWFGSELAPRRLRP